MSDSSARRDFRQVAWDARLAADWEKLIRLAVEEDLAERGDLTSQALVPLDVEGAAAVAARHPGVVAGLPGVEPALAAIEPRLRFTPQREEGSAVEPGDRLGVIAGPIRGMLSAERLVLNFLGRLSGIATSTRRYVEAVRAAGADARVYDTRKTTPGWRRLEKYAVRCGGGWNHRGGLDEAVLIKDNHLAAGLAAPYWHTPAEAVGAARRFLEQNLPPAAAAATIVEVEVDTLAQLEAVLPARPDVILLDNMTPGQLREAVARRDAARADVELEASGGIDLSTIGEIARSGVDRISVGALTHSAPALDLGLDWLAGEILLA